MTRWWRNPLSDAAQREFSALLEPLRANPNVMSVTLALDVPGAPRFVEVCRADSGLIPDTGGLRLTGFGWKTRQADTFGFPSWKCADRSHGTYPTPWDAFRAALAS